nr:HigA family addiction module antitoxin [uncultured Desulfobacter sp.]
MKKIPTVHPGEILLEEFIRPYGLTQYKLAKDIGVSQMRISEIVNGKRSITTDTSLRLSKYFGLSPSYWVMLQIEYDIDMAMDNHELATTIDKIVPVNA